jgi:phosphatidylglycerol:prolipoprotein diacylglycerol transferase
MLIYPRIDPIALQVGPLAVRWYGLMYLLAFLQFWCPGCRHMRESRFARLFPQ